MVAGVSRDSNRSNARRTISGFRGGGDGSRRERAWCDIVGGSRNGDRENGIASFKTNECAVSAQPGNLPTSRQPGNDTQADHFCDLTAELRISCRAQLELSLLERHCPRRRDRSKNDGGIAAKKVMDGRFGFHGCESRHVSAMKDRMDLRSASRNSASSQAHPCAKNAAMSLDGDALG